MHRAYAARYASSCFLFSLSPYSVPPPTPSTPPIAAPLPAPFPPPAIAPPAAPTAAPTTAPIAASLTTSLVLSPSPTCADAYRLQASTTSCVGTAGPACTVRGGAGFRLVGRGCWTCRVLAGAFCSASWFEPDQFATTRPVISAVAMTSAMASAVIFQGFHLSITSLPCRHDEPRRPRSHSSRLRWRWICHRSCRWRAVRESYPTSAGTWRRPDRGSSRARAPEPSALERSDPTPAHALSSRRSPPA